jgi:hypothetical protein
MGKRAAKTRMHSWAAASAVQNVRVRQVSVRSEWGWRSCLEVSFGEQFHNLSVAGQPRVLAPNSTATGNGAAGALSAATRDRGLCTSIAS